MCSFYVGYLDSSLISREHATHVQKPPLVSQAVFLSPVNINVYDMYSIYQLFPNQVQLNLPDGWPLKYL